MTALHGAVYTGVPEIVTALVDINKWDVNTTDYIVRTALRWAVRRGHAEVLEIHLERDNVDPNMADTEYGRTPLSLAVENGHVAVVSLLLEREHLNSNPAEIGDGRTPLMWAVEAGNGKVVEMLLARHDLDLHTPYFSGKTALSLATSKGHSPVVRLLSGHNRSLANSPDINGAHEHPLTGAVRPPLTLLSTASPSLLLPTNSDTTPLDIGEATECASPEPLHLPSPEPLDLPQPTPQPILPSASPSTDPDTTTPPIHDHHLRTLFGSCICWNGPNSQR